MIIVILYQWARIQTRRRRVNLRWKSSWIRCVVAWVVKNRSHVFSHQFQLTWRCADTLHQYFKEQRGDLQWPAFWRYAV